MKLSALLLVGTALFAGAGLASAAGEPKDHAHEAKAQHGGVVSVVKDVNYELVASASELRLYVSDHGKPAELTGAKARLTMLSGSKKEEATLAPAGGALQAKGSYAVAAGTKVVAQVALQGKPAQSVRFTLK